MSGSTSAVLLLSGTSPNPRGLAPPAAQNMAAFYEFASTDREIARRNLRLSSAPAAVVGAPTFAGGYATIPGNATDYIDTGLTETAAMGAVIMMRVAGGFNTGFRHRMLANYNTTGLVFFLGANGLELFVTREGTSTPSQMGKLATPADGYANWNILSFAVGGTDVRIRNLTAGTVISQTLSSARAVLVPETLRIGTNASPTPAQPRATDIRSLCIWRNYMPTMEDENANARLMQQRAAASGITVNLAV